MSQPQRPVVIVCLGASNTEGYGVSRQSAYPMCLGQLLAARGIASRVINAGVSGDTTAGMLARLDDALPAGTDVVIFQPGINDLHDAERRTANIRAILARLTTRGVAVITLDNAEIRSLPATVQAADGIHLTTEGYRLLAETLLPRVLEALAGLRR